MRSASGGAARNRNKHGRLFDPAGTALKQGQVVAYVVNGRRLLLGEVCLAAGGILCSHCNQ
ncbi:PHD-type domain-containing protein, partial [Haematococcus lacustris]